MPKEPLGASNYPKLAKPKYDKAKFMLLEGNPLEMEIFIDTIF